MGLVQHEEQEFGEQEPGMPSIAVRVGLPRTEHGYRLPLFTGLHLERANRVVERFE